MLLKNTILFSFLISSFLLVLTIAIANKIKNKKQKKYEFECGFNSISKSRLPFSTQFFLISILFLIFDLEISIVLPISVEENKNIFNMINILVIIMVLTMGLMIEWKEGLVEWSK